MKVRKFKILETYTYCSSAPWRRGIDRVAYRYVKYEYSLNKKVYIEENDKLFGFYRINFLNSCNSLKQKNEKQWNEYNKNNYLLYSNGKKSKVLISNELFNINTSVFLSILLEIQGALFTLLIVILCTLIYDLVRR